MKRMMTMAAVLLLAAGAAAAGDYTEIFDRTYATGNDPAVGLDNINGDVTVEVWDRAEVRVYAVKSASSPERLERLEIDVDESPRGIFIDTKYPSSRDLPGADRRGHSEVEYTLSVPRFAALEGIELVNGDLLVDGVEGGIDVETVNGAVVIRRSAGEIDVETVNGRIELELGSVVTDHVTADSVNGTIEVFTAGPAEIRAETVNGRISNDFGIEVKKGKYVGSSMNGTVGGGGPVIEMETVNGAIRVSSP